MYLYAVVLFEEEDVLNDMIGNKYLVSCAKEGHAEANLLLGKRFQHSEDPEMKMRVVLFYEIAADKGIPEAMFLFANMVSKGEGIEKSEYKAKEYYKKAIDAGYAEAIIKYGEILAEDISLPKAEKDLECLKAAADNGNDKALTMYARCLYRDINEYENKEEIAHYVKLAVDKTDDAKMMHRYGKMLHDGIGVEESARYFEMAALKEDIDGAFEYAEMLYNGDGVELDKKKAADFYRIAADKDHSEAMKKLGDMLIYGDGIEMNKDEGNNYRKKGIDNEKSLRANEEMARGIASYFGMAGVIDFVLH